MFSASFHSNLFSECLAAGLVELLWLRWEMLFWIGCTLLRVKWADSHSVMTSLAMTSAQSWRPTVSAWHPGSPRPPLWSLSCSPASQTYFLICLFQFCHLLRVSIVIASPQTSLLEPFCLHIPTFIPNSIWAFVYFFSPGIGYYLFLVVVWCPYSF